MVMQRTKHPRRQVFTRAGFWLMVVLVFSAAFLTALAALHTGHPARSF
jgi:hypothetical protein